MEPEIILRIVGAIHIFVSPFTKVEESFNIQAIHDIAFHRLRLSNYDHLEFPGVVPRTFIGALVIGILTCPFAQFIKLFISKFAVQILVRLVLGEIVIRAFQIFRISISRKFGPNVGYWLIVITASQFHFMYYMGRTLPNIFALPGVLLAVHFWLEGNHFLFILTSAFDAIVFRAELALFFGILLIYELICKRISIIRSIKFAILGGLGSLSLTILIDSVFWGRWVWPEGEVLWFNTAQNQSHKWGTSPFLWYFYSALPRSLACSVFLIPIGLWLDHRVRQLVLPSLLFVFFYSFLPHKELRFIIYVIPLLNVAAANACDRIWKNQRKGFLPLILTIGVIFHIVVNSVISTSFLIISKQNYPGGAALQLLHGIESRNAAVNVHFDVYSAQTGISRFSELYGHWKYNKTENLEPGGKDLMSFTHLLVSISDFEARYAYFKTHEVAGNVEAFDGLDINIFRYPPIRIKTEQSIVILRRRNFR